MASSFQAKPGSIIYFLRDSPATRTLIQQTTALVAASARESYMSERTSTRVSPIRFRTDYGAGEIRYRGAVIATHPNVAAQARIESALGSAGARHTEFKTAGSDDA